MRFALLIASGCLAGGVVACGSDDSAGGGGGASGKANAEAGATSGGRDATAGASAGSGSAHAGTSAGGSSAGASAGGSSGHAGTSNAGSASGGGAGLSPACQMFCECHERNCATTAIPGGESCGDFCTAMTADQLACRQNMCGLVPAQPDNNHCKHSVGIDECL